MIVDEQLNDVKGSDVKITVEFGEDRDIKTLNFLMKNFHFEISSEPEKEYKDGHLYYKPSRERKISISGVLKRE